MEETKPTPSGPGVQKGCGLALGGATLAFFGCLGAIAAGSNGFLVFVMGSFFVAGVVIAIVALIQRFTKTR